MSPLCGMLLGLLCSLLCCPSCAFSWTVASPYFHFTRRLSPDLYTGGKLTERQIMYLAEGGFKSIVITLPQSEPLDSFNGVAGPFPSSEQEVQIAKQFGMTAVVLDTSLTTEWVDKVSDTILSLEKPVYVHCGVGYGASLFSQLHLFRAGVTPASQIFPDSLTLGWDYQADANAVALVNAYAQLSPPAEVTEPSIEKTLADGENSYKYYYWSHRVGNDLWYNIGQVLDTQVQTIADAGYKTVISFRNNGESTTRTSVDPAEGAVDNNEFSDSSGNYNVTAEQIAFESVGVRFINLPVTGDDWTPEKLAEYSPAMAEAASLGPVLAHCKSGYRSSAFVTAFLANSQGMCTSWALQQARRIGYSFDVSEADATVMQFYEKSLKC